MNQGYLTSNGTSGTFVSRKLPDEEISALTKEGSADATPLTRAPQDDSFLRANRSNNGIGEVSFDIRGSNPTMAPERTWRQLLIKHLPYQSRHAGKMNPAGLEMLRDAVANSISPLRGMSIRIENCAIVQDDYRAIDTISRLINHKNRRVAVENPCDAGLYYLLRSQGAEIVSIPLDREGVIVDQLRNSAVSSVFVTPSHQQPTGITMSKSRRLELLDWASMTGGHIVEWDTFGEFCYDDSPIPSLFSLDKSDRVIYINSFSSWIGCGAQLCYVVFPPGLMSQFLTIKNFLNPEPPWLDQRVAADFISTDGFFNHLRRIRQHLKVLRNNLIDEITKNMGEQTISGRQAGRHLVWHLPKGGLSSMEIQKRVASSGIFTPTLYDGYCCIGLHNEKYHPDRTILLGYSCLNDELIKAGILQIATSCQIGLPAIGQR